MSSDNSNSNNNSNTTTTTTTTTPTTTTNTADNDNNTNSAVGSADGQQHGTNGSMDMMKSEKKQQEDIAAATAAAAAAVVAAVAARGGQPSSSSAATPGDEFGVDFLVDPTDILMNMAKEAMQSRDYEEEGASMDDMMLEDHDEDQSYSDSGSDDDDDLRLGSSGKKRKRKSNGLGKRAGSLGGSSGSGGASGGGTSGGSAGGRKVKVPYNWSDEEISNLFKYVQQCGDDWTAIANGVGSRGSEACYAKFMRAKQNKALMKRLGITYEEPEEGVRPPTTVTGGAAGSSSASASGEHKPRAPRKSMTAEDGSTLTPTGKIRRPRKSASADGADGSASKPSSAKKHGTRAKRQKTDQIDPNMTPNYLSLLANSPFAAKPEPGIGSPFGPTIIPLSFYNSAMLQGLTQQQKQDLVAGGSTTPSAASPQSVLLLGNGALSSQITIKAQLIDRTQPSTPTTASVSSPTQSGGADVQSLQQQQLQQQIQSDALNPPTSPQMQPQQPDAESQSTPEGGESMFRMTSVPLNITLPELFSHFSGIFGAALNQTNSKLTYADTDGDMITLSHQNEWQFAVREFMRMRESAPSAKLRLVITKYSNAVHVVTPQELQTQEQQPHPLSQFQVLATVPSAPTTLVVQEPPQLPQEFAVQPDQPQEQQQEQQQAQPQEQQQQQQPQLSS